MNINWILNILAIIQAQYAIADSIPQKDYNANDYFLIELKNSNSLDSLKLLHPNWSYEHQSRALENYHVFSLPKNHSDFNHLTSYHHHCSLNKRSQIWENLYDNGVKAIHKLNSKKLYHRAPIPIPTDSFDYVFKRAIDSSQIPVLEAQEKFGINDPIFPEQWHILNTASLGDDVNVIPVWDMGITGKGIVTAIVDDGLDYESLDLKDNYSAEGSWDFNSNRQNPRPDLQSDYHGTRCAGEIAAVKGNGQCGVGVAFNSKVSGIRILSGDINAEDEAASLVYALDVNDIFSCSWGPPDNGKAMDVPDKVVREAMLKGIQDGRNGKGALYVFASGNGAHNGDNCNFDGYTNSIYSITVSSIDYKGLHPPYSESCTAVMVSTYSSGSGEHIHTTDVHGKCTDSHGGTSAAAPLAAGIYSLILEANPDLTWRDVQYLTVLSAVEINSHDESWQDSAIESRRYSTKFGWGKIDAEKMVKKAQNWVLLKPQGWYYMPYQNVDKSVEKSLGEVEDSFVVDLNNLERANFESIEQITVTVDIDSSIRGDVEVDLISPNGIKSPLAVTRHRDSDSSGFKKWTFSTVAHWGENAVGEWKIIVRNAKERNSLTFKGWQIKFFGSVIDSTKAKRFNMDEDYSDLSKFDEIISDTLEETATLTSTLTNPTTDTEPSETTVESQDLTTTEQTTASPTGDYSDEDKSVETTTESTATSTSTSAATATSHVIGTTDHYMWYFFTIFTIGFGLVMYLFFKSRRSIGRARRRDDFEFDIIRPSDDESRIEFDFDDEFDLRDDDYSTDAMELGDLPSTLNSIDPSSTADAELDHVDNFHVDSSNEDENENAKLFKDIK
ncbi:kexin [Martiniozyma asiatica (nom. inval.)]|nr:kexin [Martiniozyma asiatica]